MIMKILCCLKACTMVIVWSDMQSHTSHIFHFYLLCMKNNTWQHNASLSKIVWKCNLFTLGFCQLFHLGCITPSCQKHKESTNVLLGLSTSVGEWSVSSTADYIILLAHLCLTGSAPPPAMKRQTARTIWCDSLTGGTLPSQFSDSFLQSSMLQTDRA